jgi:hypothetical protein
VEPLINIQVKAEVNLGHVQTLLSKTPQGNPIKEQLMLDFSGFQAIAPPKAHETVNLFLKAQDAKKSKPIDILMNSFLDKQGAKGARKMVAFN